MGKAHRATGNPRGRPPKIRIIVKVGGVRRDPSDGLRLRAGSVKYDFLNGINCVYLTYLV